LLSIAGERLEGEPLPGISSSHLSSLLSTMRGEYSTPWKWVCCGNLIQCLYVLSLLKFI
jgi:hypothetical protein